MRPIREVDALIVGGGPAGLVLAILLQREGHEVLVLERNADFAREYRGEVLMPRFTALFRRAGLWDLVAEIPHKTLERLEVFWGDRPRAQVSLREVCPEIPFALWMPQTQLLGALHRHGSSGRGFSTWFDSKPKELLQDGSRVIGAVVDKDGEEIEVRARVTVGADGRFSVMRKLLRAEVEYEDYAFDVLWFTIAEPQGHPAAFRAYLTKQRGYLALPKHPASIQAGMFVPPHGLGAYVKRGIESMRTDLLAGPELLHPFARALREFAEFHPLAAKLDLVKRWACDGALLIGDAAHTCSPVGAIGVSIAIHTAIVASEVIAAGLKRGDVSEVALREVQTRREPAVRNVHSMQRAIGGPIARGSPWVRRAFAALLPLAVRSGLIQRRLRPLVTLEAE